MFSAYLVFGFIVFFTGIGYLVYYKECFIRGKRESVVARCIIMLLFLFAGIYGCAFSLLTKVKLKSVPETIGIISCFLLVYTILTCLCAGIRLVYNKKDGFSWKNTITEVLRTFLEIASSKSKNDNYEKRNWDVIRWKRIDYVYMILLTFACSVLIFLRLGSFSVPESFMTLDADLKKGDELVLDLGEEMDVKELSLFLGHMEERTIAVSYYNEKAGEWEVLQEDSMAESVYRWGTIQVDKKLRYLGLVARDRQAIINELVILDKDGKKLQPVNALRYPELFDEQEKYPQNNTYYYGTMFDEVYYARSAYELLQGMDTFEWTHPPLSKIFMAVGVYLFGVTPFGWRCVCALAGVFIIPVMYGWVLRLTGRTRYACMAATLVILDFMHLTLSRIATIDSIVALFILLMFALMYGQLWQWRFQLSQKKVQISGRELFYMLSGAVMTGIACACKWTGFYAVFGIAILFFLSFLNAIMKYRGNHKIIVGAWKRFGLTGIIYLVGICSIYIVSYIPMAKANGISVLQAAVNNSVEMFQFHSVITFDHPYASPWYTWLFDLVPLVDAGTIMSDGTKISMVVTMGNPIIWWCGLIAFTYVLYRACFHKDKKAFYLSFAYLSMLVPWMFISRTVFIYQYYVCALLLCVMLGYAMQEWEKRWKNSSVLLLETALVCFILFYPILSGINVHAGVIASFLEWLPTWNFSGS